jgi:hypothetical protein
VAFFKTMHNFGDKCPNFLSGLNTQDLSPQFYNLPDTKRMGLFILKPLIYCYALLIVATVHPKPLSRPHPIHVSTSNIEFNKQDNKLEVICSMFTDDFEAALAKEYHAKTDLSKTEMHAAMEELVKKYLAENLFISADDKSVKLNFLGFEINREYAEVYLESDQLPPIKKVDVTVSLLYNLFDDQMNIVHVIVNGTRKSEKVNYPDKKVEQVF